MNDLKDRIVMITGASSGFGREAARMLVSPWSKSNFRRKKRGKAEGTLC